MSTPSNQIIANKDTFEISAFSFKKKDKLFSKILPDNPLNLLYFYLTASYSNPLETTNFKVSLGLTINQNRLFRTYKTKDLLNQYTE